MEGMKRVRLTRRLFSLAIISGVKAHGARVAGPLAPPCVQTFSCSWRAPGLPCQWRRVSSGMLEISKRRVSVIVVVGLVLR